MITAREVRARLADVERRIADAGGTDVAILAVTKGFEPELIRVAAEAGCMRIGENYAQELLAKQAMIESIGGLGVHFVGQLQSNKVRQLAGLVTRFDSVDRSKLVNEIAKRRPGAAVLIQVDTSAVTGDDSDGKGGCPLADVDQLVATARDAGLDVQGLMTVGPTTGGAEAARPGFDAVRAAVDANGLSVCSMGMSGDVEVAVECGSTEIRVGTALFGPRPVPNWREQGR